MFTWISTDTDTTIWLLTEVNRSYTLILNWMKWFYTLIVTEDMNGQKKKLYSTFEWKCSMINDKTIREHYFFVKTENLDKKQKCSTW